MTVLRLEISGSIASGKTTLAGLLKKSLETVTLFEDFQANPFWKQFYADPAGFAFETEVTFLLQHYNQIKAVKEANDLIVCDFSFLLDRAYVDVTLPEEERRVFLAVFEEVQRQLGPPTLYVHLGCSPEEGLRRIRARARETEKGIEVDYLANLNDALAKHVKAIGSSTPILRIDSENRDFATDPACQKEVVAEIVAALG